MVRLGAVLLGIGAVAAGVGVWRFMVVKCKLALTYKKLDKE